MMKIHHHHLHHLPQHNTTEPFHTVSTIKLHILKKGEYDIWSWNEPHYLSHTDYPIWEVIQKGNGPVSVSTDTNGVIKQGHLAKFHRLIDAKEMWDAIKSRFGGNDESKKMQKYILKQQFEGFSISNSEGLHKGYDRFQSLLSQLEIHSAGVSTKDANQKFFRSLPSSWSQVSLVMRTKPGVDSLIFNDLYNNLRVFESDVKGSTGSSSSAQNVAFVSSESTSSTNDVSTAYGVSTSSGYNPQKENSLSYTDELIKDGLEMTSSHDFNEIEEVYKKTGRRLQFDAKEPVGFDKTKEEPKALVTLDGEGVDWIGHAEDEQENFALMAYNNSGSDTKVTSCSKECVESYAKLKKLYDEQREQLGDASIEIQAYTQALKKMSTRTKSGLGFDNVDGMHDVPPLITGNYMPLGPEREALTATKPTLLNIQDYNGALLLFGGCKGYITGKEDEILSQPVRSENQANKTTSPKEANYSAGTQDNIDAGNSKMEADPAQDYFVLPIYSSYTSTVKSSEAKNEGEKSNKDTGLKTNEEPVDQEDQAFLEELERLKRQEKEANDAAEALRKEFAQEAEDLLIQAGAARATSTNTVNTVSTPISTASPSNVFSTGGPALNNTNQDDSQIPALEDIYDNPSDGIFTNASYDDEGAVADFTNLESTVNRIAAVQDSKSLDSCRFALWEEGYWNKMAFASYMGFIVYQMDVKSAFLYGKIDEEVYVSQPPGFIDPNMDTEEETTLLTWSLFIKKDNMIYIRYKVYVDDIIFGSTKKTWCDDFEALMKGRFQMSSMGELTFFLGLQVKQKADGIFISQDKYVAEILKKFDFVNVKTASTQFETQKPLVSTRANPNWAFGFLKVSSIDLEPTQKVGSMLGANLDKEIYNKRLSNFLAGSSLGFRESLGRALDGTEALMLPKLFILWLATVSTDSAELVPMGKHNMVAYLEKTNGNAEFHEIIDFLTRSSIHHALTVSPVVSTTFVEQFWTSAKKAHLYLLYVGKKPTEDEGAPSERPSEAQPTPSPPHPSEATVDPQSDPSLRPSPSTTIPRFCSRKVMVGSWRVQYPVIQSFQGNEGTWTLQSVYDLVSLCGTQVLDQCQENSTLEGIDQVSSRSKSNVIHTTLGMDESVSLNAKVGRKEILKEKLVMQKEYVSKQGRKSAKAEPSVHKDPLFDEIPEDTLDYMETRDAQNLMEGQEMVVDEEKENAEDGTDEQSKGTDDHTEEGSATQTTQPPTSTIFGDDETIAQVLLNMSQAKAVSREKEKGVEFKDIEETDRPRPTSTRSLLTLKPLPKIDPKDKGKKKIEEEDESESESDGIPEAEKKFKQLASDEEMARKVQEEWEGEEERKRLAEEEATNDDLIRNYDDIKARIEADRLLAEKLQEEEREQFTVEERAKFLHDTIAAQRRFLAQQRSEAIRNRPPTKNQLRNQMMTYLKHVGNFKHAELKIKKFEEVQALYEKIKRSDEDFISIGSAEDERLIKRMNEKGVDFSKDEMIKEESKAEVQEESKEEEKINQNVVIKVMDKMSILSTLMRVLSIFDREDLNVVYQLVMDRFQDEIPEGFDRLDWSIMSWKLRSSSGVHTLVTETGLVIHMLVEKKYPLRKEVLMKMLNLKLESEEDSTMALELIKFVKKLLAELEPED
ncbi:putative ribonuclease H-like domain-containing protein [Tanacetum coccineum]